MNLQGNINQLLSMGALIKSLGKEEPKKEIKQSQSSAPPVKDPEIKTQQITGETELSDYGETETMEDYSMGEVTITPYDAMKKTKNVMTQIVNQNESFAEWRNSVYGETDKPGK